MHSKNKKGTEYDDARAPTSSAKSPRVVKKDELVEGGGSPPGQATALVLEEGDEEGVALLSKKAR
jgi:hypothetical protein